MGKDMVNTTTKNSLSSTLYLLIAASGFATLAWEVLWQIKATLALGISAWGTAITLAVIMGGMSLGGLLNGWYCRTFFNYRFSGIRNTGCLGLP
jgi:hypothetical protein